MIPTKVALNSGLIVYVLEETVFKRCFRETNSFV